MTVSTTKAIKTATTHGGVGSVSLGLEDLGFPLATATPLCDGDSSDDCAVAAAFSAPAACLRVTTIVEKG